MWLVSGNKKELKLKPLGSVSIPLILRKNLNFKQIESVFFNNEDESMI